MSTTLQQNTGDSAPQRLRPDETTSIKIDQYRLFVHGTSHFAHLVRSAKILIFAPRRSKREKKPAGDWDALDADRSDQRLDPDDVHDPCQIVGEDQERHFTGYFGKRSGQEVCRSHKSAVKIWGSVLLSGFSRLAAARPP